MPFSPTVVRLPMTAALQALTVAVTTFWNFPAFAQNTDPLDPQSPSTPLSYRSAFEGYRAYRSDPPPSWRSVNDAVRAIGGHTGSVRNVEIAEPEPTKPTPEMQTAPEAPAPKAFPREPVQTEPAPGHHGH